MQFVDKVHMKLWRPYEEDARQLSSQGVEVWAALPEGPYFISNQGRVYDQRKNREVPHRLGSSGYPTVFLRGQGRRYVRRLVLQVFEGNISPRRRRVNGRRSDIRLCDLSYAETPGLLSASEKELVIKAIAEGNSQAEIARRFGMTPSHVHYYAKKLSTS